MLLLYAPQKPESLVSTSTAARVTLSGSVTSGWSTLDDRLTTASTARVSSRAYGPASRMRCWARMMRDEAISSWARVIFPIDWTARIRCRTARSVAAMPQSFWPDGLLAPAGASLGLPSPGFPSCPV